MHLFSSATLESTVWNEAQPSAAYRFTLSDKKSATEVADFV